MRDAQYYVDNKLQPPKAFFDWCHSKIPTYKWKNKEQTILASERKNCFVIEKRLAKNSNLTFFGGFHSFAIVLVTAKRIEIQSYGFWVSVENGKELIDFGLVNLEQFASDLHVKVGGRGDFYSYGLSSNYGGMSSAYTGTRFYENNWEKRIKQISELRYLKFKSLSYFDIENIYKYRSEIEFLQKINARVLSDEVMYPSVEYSGCSTHKNVDMRTINSNWLRKNKQYFKNSDRSFMEYELEKRIKERNGKVVPGIEKYLNFRDIKKIPSKARIVNFQNWIIKNKVDFNYYCDYIDTLKELNIEVNTDNLITPKDLTKAHDDAVKVLNLIKQEIREKEEAEARVEKKKKQAKDEKEYARRMKQLLKYETVIDDYAFVAPKSLNDLITEGIKLEHCVGGSEYLEKHKTGKTTIIFVRDKNSVDVPLCTLEYRTGQIIQLQGKGNKEKNVPEEAKVAVDHWLEWTKTIKNKRKA
ncbi:PcfJ domain-containing protein [Carnobacterium divergens]|uniref:PcfJ domain-containing protein n=1 Tax=Carnobacterium divergens TaxID=2748 RepID=UPI0039C95294